MIQIGDDLADTEKARLKLANAVLSIADEDSRDVDVLKNAALQRMALDYRDKPQPAYHQLKPQPTTSRTDQ